MDNIEKKEKVILKRSALPGVDMSVVDLELVSTVKIRVTIVKKPIYKVRSQTFIGTKDQLDKMDVIQVGSLRLKYRVMKLVKLTDYDGYIYRIKRIDGASTTGLDIHATAIGQKVSIVNRPTFDDLFNYACSLKEEIPDPVTVDLCNTDACDKKSPITQSAISNRQYRITYGFGLAGLIISWIDSSNNEQSFEAIDVKNPVELVVCAKEGSVQFGGVAYWPNNVPCPPGPACSISLNPTLELLGDC